MLLRSWLCGGVLLVCWNFTENYLWFDSPLWIEPVTWYAGGNCNCFVPLLFFPYSILLLPAVSLSLVSQCTAKFFSSFTYIFEYCSVFKIVRRVSLCMDFVLFQLESALIKHIFSTLKLQYRKRGCMCMLVDLELTVIVKFQFGGYQHSSHLEQLISCLGCFSGQSMIKSQWRWNMQSVKSSCLSSW